MTRLTRPFPFLTLPFRKLLLILVVIDVAFILVNLVAAIARDVDLISAVPPMLKISEDRALPEGFNYLKWMVICAALLLMGLRTRWLAPALWATVFFLILIDDSFQLHEHFGSRLATLLELADYSLLSGTAMGEIAAFGAMGMLAVALVGALFRQRDPETQLLSQRYLVIILALGIFGVGFDLMHAAVRNLTFAPHVVSLLSQIFTVIEDGGEMLVASLAVALTLVPDAGRNKLQPQRS